MSVVCSEVRPHAIDFLFRVPEARSIYILHKDRKKGWKKRIDFELFSYRYFDVTNRPVVLRSLLWCETTTCCQHIPNSVEQIRLVQLDGSMLKHSLSNSGIITILPEFLEAVRVPQISQCLPRRGTKQGV